MTSTPATTGRTPSAPPSELAARLRGFAALATAAMIFWTVGWLAIQPLDPGGPVMLMAADHRARALVLMGVLAAVAATLAIVIAGRNARTVGPMAVAVGLAALNWRGAQSDMIGGYVGGEAVTGWPAGGMTFELWLWLAILVIGVCVGRWSGGRLARREAVPPQRTDSAAAGPAIAAAALTAVMAFVAMRLLTGAPQDEVLKQQLYFSIALSFMAACFLVQSLLHPALWWWPVVAIGLLGSAVYLMLAPGSASDAGVAALRALPSTVARPLPIEFASMGMIGALLGTGLATPTAAAESFSPAQPDKMAQP